MNILMNLNRQVWRQRVMAVSGLAVAVALTGCATPPPKSDSAEYQAYQQKNDPLEPTNRAFFSVNSTLDTYVMHPVAQGYVDITTQPIRAHVSDFTSNIGEPARFLNFVLEAKPNLAVTAFGRFLVNSTVGIGGIFDPATSLGMPETDTDFGITLAVWGFPAGPYLYLPVFGPSGARDVWNLPVEYFATPMEAAPESAALNDFGYAETGLNILNLRAGLIPTINDINATALDPYATFRSLYRQSRDAELQQINLREAAASAPPSKTP
jgi:phospholipid-binding lipoprotein MlaA